MQLNSSLVRRKDIDLIAPFAKTILRGSHQFKSQELISNSGQNETVFAKQLNIYHFLKLYLWFTSWSMKFSQKQAFGRR